MVWKKYLTPAQRELKRKQNIQKLISGRGQSPIVYIIIQDNVILKYGRSKAGKLPKGIYESETLVFPFRDEDMMNNFYKIVKIAFDNQHDEGFYPTYVTTSATNPDNNLK